MSRIERLAQALAYFICYPGNGIEIGGVSSQLVNILKIQTKGNDRLRGKVNVVPIETIEGQRDQNVIKIDENWKLKDLVVKETWIWKDPNPEHRYIISCDPSSGSGNDYTAIEIIDVDAVHEWLEFYIEDGDTQISEYKDNIQLAFDDYDKVFYD